MSAMANIEFKSILFIIRSTMGYFGSTSGSTLEYIGSNLVYVGYVQSTLEYIGSALVCIAFVCSLVSI